MSNRAATPAGRPAGRPGIGGPFADGAFVYPLRVFYEDTDAAGIVYYANYLKFVERARTEMMRAAGIDHSGMRERHGVLFIVKRCALDYCRPARLDDWLEIRTRITALKGASLEAEQTVMRLGEVLVRADLRLACIHENGAPARFPADLKAALEALMHDSPQAGAGS
jgi:acyl-CoA thioester hydrolase